jgi:hypothetical protein
MLEMNWKEGQARLAALSTDSVLIVAKNSDHMIQQDEPALVADAIRWMYAAVKKGDSLVLSQTPQGPEVRWCRVGPRFGSYHPGIKSQVVCHFLK